MKPKTNLLRFLAIAGSSIVAISSASAQIYWDGPSASWNAAANWTTVPGAITPNPAAAPGAADATIFNRTGQNGNITVTLDANQAAQSLTFNSTGTTTFRANNAADTTARTLSIGTGGITVAANAGNVTFGNNAGTNGNVNLVLTGNQTWTNNKAPSTSTTEALSLGVTTGNLNYGSNTWTIDGTGVTGFATNATITGSGDLIKNGTGTFVFNSATADNVAAGFTGNIFLNGGVARFQNVNNLGSGNININGGILEGRFGQTFSYAQGGAAGQVQITGGISGFSGQGSTGTTFNIGDVTWGSGTFNPTQFVLQSATTNLNGNSTFQSNINLGGATRTIRSDQATTDIVSGIGTFSGNISNGGIIKEGVGHHVFTGTNSYAGGTTINSGTLRFNTIASMPNSGAVTVNNGATLGVGIGGSGWTTGTSGVGTLGGLLSGLGGAGTSTVEYNGNVGLLLNVTANSTYSGNIANPTGATSLGLTKIGGSSLILSGDNSYTGVTTIGQGVLSIGSIANAGSNSGIGNFASAGAAGLVLQGGSLTYTGGTATTNRGFTFGAATTGTINVATAGAKLTMGDSIFNGTANQTLTVSGGAGSSLDINSVTSSNSSKTITANIAVSIGTVTVLSNSIFDSGGTQLLTIGNFVAPSGATIGGSGGLITGSIDVGANTLTKAGGATWTYTGTSTTGNLTINGGAGGFAVGGAGTLGTAGTYAGNIVHGAANTFTYNSSANQTLTGNHTGTGILAVTGTGTLTLNGGTRSYTGDTNITNGRLAVIGSTALSGTTGNVNINGGTLRYNSSVAMTRTVNFTSGTLEGTNWQGTLGGLMIGAGQTLSPGNSPGTATTTSQTWASGGSYQWEINDATGTAGGDPGWDLINGSATLNITASAGNEFNINVFSLTSGNTAGALTNFNDLFSYAWLIADFASITGFSATAFNIDTTQFGLHNSFTGTFGVSLGGAGFVPGDDSQIYLTYVGVIPEPKTALLGALGLLALLRRRR